MHRLAAPTLALFAGMSLTGCLATQSQLKHASDQQSAQLAQANAALAAERAERAASDSALGQQLGIVRGDVQALRTDLATMRTEFGAKITAMEDGLHFALPVTFGFDDAAVRDTAAIVRFARIASSYYPGSKITIEGFADPAGTSRYNLALSKRRADAVRSYLVAQGLNMNELNAVGYGETRLVTPGAAKDEPGAELNRRVVFVIESRGEKSLAVAPETPTP